MTAIPSSTVSLPSGAGMPLVGFGTWQLKGPEAREASTWALQAGYRHLDTATMYGNEREVGAALAGSGISRDEVFVTTKLPPSRAGQERDTLQQSLTELGVPSVDLWLVHAKPSGGGSSVAVWKQFVQAQADGLATDIGVSNYSLSDLDELREATGVLPSTRSNGARCCSTRPSSTGTGTAASSSRATAPCAAAPWTTPRSATSPSGWAVRRLRSLCAGTCSTASW